MIYTRFGDPVKLIRPATDADIRQLSNRRPDKHDRQRMSYGMYAIGVYPDSEEEILLDLGLLRADDGIREINKAARDAGCDPK